mmetsp:Transcript_23220/g.65626  ORF Transcript_23220/g.65626 Transcript_23220/m.65626 type:complete len:327 (+) Transcript_23220:1351-2331(+)
MVHDAQPVGDTGFAPHVLEGVEQCRGRLPTLKSLIVLLAEDLQRRHVVQHARLPPGVPQFPAQQQGGLRGEHGVGQLALGHMDLQQRVSEQGGLPSLVAGRAEGLQPLLRRRQRRRQLPPRQMRIHDGVQGELLALGAAELSEERLGLLRHLEGILSSLAPEVNGRDLHQLICLLSPTLQLAEEIQGRLGIAQSFVVRSLDEAAAGEAVQGSCTPFDIGKSSVQLERRVRCAHSVAGRLRGNMDSREREKCRGLHLGVPDTAKAHLCLACRPQSTCQVALQMFDVCHRKKHCSLSALVPGCLKGLQLRRRKVVGFGKLLLQPQNAN